MQNNNRIIFLDWLRVVAFVSVFIGHKFAAIMAVVMNDPAAHASMRGLLSFLYPFVHGGGAGVVIFFFVSGYIITNVLMKEEAIEFLFKRFFRIYPLYVVAVAIEAVLNYYANGQFVGFGVLLQQMSLLGDFFETPHALKGVEWTLRIEVLFYVAMAVLKFAGFINGRFTPAFPYVLAGIVLFLFAMTPFPGRWTWSFAYVNLYAPFLFLGVFYFLVEKKTINATICCLMTLFVIVGYWLLIPVLQPAWISAHFVIYAFILFFAAWFFRGKLRLPGWALLLSELTYSFYLFHNWLYDWVVLYVKSLLSNAFLVNVWSVLILLFICWIFLRVIEKPFVKIGKNLFKKYIAKKMIYANQ